MKRLHVTLISLFAFLCSSLSYAKGGDFFSTAYHISFLPSVLNNLDNSALNSLSYVNRDLRQYSEQIRFKRFLEFLIGPTVQIEAGKFEFGSPSFEVGRFPDEPLLEGHRLDYTYQIAKYPVTNLHFFRAMRLFGNPPEMNDSTPAPNHPKTQFSRESLSEYLNTLNSLISKRHQLINIPSSKAPIIDIPTEEEWEKASTSKDGQHLLYSAPSEELSCWKVHLFQLSLPDSDNTLGNYVHCRHPHEGPKDVYELEPNDRGVVGLSGNTYEVVRMPDGNLALKGGAYNTGHRFCRTACTISIDNWQENKAIGIRLVVRYPQQ